MKKLKLGAILLLFISCNIRSQNGQSLLSKQNIDNNSDTGTEKIDYPVTINEVKIGTTPYFKMFKGEVESKKLTILMRRSNDDGVFRISNGYYYFNDETGLRRHRKYRSLKRHSAGRPRPHFHPCDRIRGAGRWSGHRSQGAERDDGSAAH